MARFSVDVRFFMPGNLGPVLATRFVSSSDFSYLLSRLS